jgi:hypothetical protein
MVARYIHRQLQLYTGGALVGLALLAGAVWFINSQKDAIGGAVNQFVEDTRDEVELGARVGTETAQRTYWTTNPLAAPFTAAAQLGLEARRAVGWD